MSQVINPTEKLAELIEGIRIAMFTTKSFDGSLTTRPMSTQQVKFDGELWFFASRSGSVANLILGEPEVNVGYADPRHGRFISVSGTAEISPDFAQAKKLWTPLLKAWFPKGLEDPDLALIRVNVHRAEYWDAPHGPVIQLIGFVKAAATGKPYRADPAEHEKIQLRH